MADLEIVGEPTEHDSPRAGKVVLTWTLADAPDPEWVQSFDMTQVSYTGPGSLDFLNLAPPEVIGTSIRWTVPAHLKLHARQYIDQRINYANG